MTIKSYKSPRLSIKEINDYWDTFWHLLNLIFSFIDYLLVLKYFGQIKGTKSTYFFSIVSKILYSTTLNSNNWLIVVPIPAYLSHKTISSTFPKGFYIDKKALSLLLMNILILFDFKTISILLASYCDHWNSFCYFPQILFFTTLTNEKIMLDFS